MPTCEAWRTLARRSFPKESPPPRSCFLDGNIQAIGDRSGSDAVFRNYVHHVFLIIPKGVWLSRLSGRHAPASALVYEELMFSYSLIYLVLGEQIESALWWLVLRSREESQYVRYTLQVADAVDG
jgi:hypothetical protein